MPEEDHPHPRAEIKDPSRLAPNHETAGDAGSSRCPHLSGYDPLSQEQLHDPYPMWAKAQSEAPVFYDDTLGMWSVTRYDDVLTVLRDPATFSAADAFALPTPIFPAAVAARIPENFSRPQMLVAKDPPEHTGLRKLMQRAFTPKRIAELEPWIRTTCHELIEGWADAGRCDLLADYTNALSLRVITRILGFDAERGPALRQWTEDLLVLAAPARDDASTTATADTVARMTRMLDVLDETRSLIGERRAHPADDVISALVAAADSGAQQLDDDDLATLALELVLAGNDTTANLIVHMVGFLLEDRQRWEEVRADPSLVPAAVEEALRRRGSSKGLFRRATRDVELAGAEIRTGDVLHVLFAAAGHDPSRFESPRQYDLHRPNAGEHLSFGRWTHFCLGAPLARLESRVALEVLLDRLPDLEVTGERLRYAPTLTTQTALAFPVTFTPPSPPALVGGVR